MDFNSLSSHVLQYSTQLLPEILPGGRINGNEYECSNLFGGNGDSLRVNIKTGIWCDFADKNVKGGDLISLYAAVFDIPQNEAYESLAKKYNFKENISKFKHYKLGEPHQVWKYNENLYTARYSNRETGKKEYRPIQIVEDKPVFKSPEIRPLYNLDKILNDEKSSILIVEGEKTCDAAEKLVNGKYICATWMGGANAVYKTDWSIIHDRTIVICPDADEAGMQAADNIAKILKNQNNKIKIINPDDKPKGWDLADALDEGWTWREFFDWGKPRTVSLSVNNNTAVQVNVQTEDVPQLTGSSVVLWDNLGLVLSSSGNPVANIDNAMRVLSGMPTLNSSIWYDEFYHQVFINGKPLSDVEEFELTVYLQGQVGLSRITDTIVSKAIKAHARRNVRNEPQNWLNSLEWDQVPRINSFLIDCTGCEDSEYTRAVSRNFILSMVARVLNPGCQCHSMVIFEGDQGKRKSTFLRSIAGEKYYTEAIESIYSNNFYQCLSGKIILEFAELSTWKKADIFKLKQMLSNSKDTYRAPYDRHQDDHKRSSIFAGTTNEYEYLEDQTGARRFWPVKTGDFNIKKTREIREQLFAEAVHIYKSEDVEYDDQRTFSSWWNVPESAIFEQEHRRICDPWEEDIRRYTSQNFNFTMDDIMESCLKIEKSKKTRYDTIRIGKIISMLGYVKKRESTGNRAYFYEINKKNHGDVEEWE